MKTESQIWQVMTGGEVYQADLPTLKQWIVEGLVRPGDMVRKGSLKWIEAGRTPALRRVFAGEEDAPAHASAPAVAVEAATQPSLHHPSPQAYAVSAATAQTAQTPAPSSSEQTALPPPHAAAPTQTTQVVLLQPATAGAGASCHNHPHEPAQFACRACGASLCGECAKFAEGTRIAVCALCGYFCRPFAEVAAEHVLHARRQEAFGLADFGEALRYPFGNVAGLLFGAGLYGLLMFAGFRGQILAYAIMFGCIALVINKVAYGKLDRDFLPDFSAFSAYDDLFMPLLLGVGVTAVSVGPTLVLVVALLFGWFGVGESPSYARTLRVAAHAQAEHPEGPLTNEDLRALVESKGDPRKEEEIQRKIKAMSPTGEMARQLAAAEREPSVTERVVAQLRAHPGLIALLLLLSLVWALVYYPMAVAVAGYTEDIWSVVNPLVGLDTIRRMGVVYAKAFLMYAALQTAGLVLGFLAALVTAPFDLPLVGNLPARFIDGALTFYINLVVACVLGLALFKSADRLGIELD